MKYVEGFLSRYGKTPAEKASIEDDLMEVKRAKYPSIAKRWPTAPTTRLGYFKAEKYQKYIQWCLYYTMDHIKEDYNFDFVKAGLALINITRLYFSYTHEYGWSTHTINLARDLFQTWRQLTLNYAGENSSNLEHVVGASNLLNDFIRHSFYDVY
jgi:hypothetical protein